ncbi:MAG TPA: ABC transporter ATP-binding protein [Phycisphaerae bacterium]|nr:ABC transporter ATP-binding protein [Phycisphaerae bacterium]
MSESANGNILEVRDLAVRFEQDEGTVRALNGASFDLPAGRSIGIVGESGCGKTISAYSVLRILPKTAKIASGEIRFRRADGSVTDLARIDPDGREMRSIRGAEIAMIFQEPMTAFSPVHTICNQISEGIRLHQGADKRAARRRAIELLGLVGIADPQARVDDYPFQLSGGMRQRAMIAMALACNPRVLIADEPTTALDVTIQAQVLRLIKSMQVEFGLSLVLITHDLGVVAHMVDQVHVMYLGRVVEAGCVERIFDEPLHPYTQALLKSIPRLSGGKRKVAPIEGSVPDPYTLPSGCAFHPRCPRRIEGLCAARVPAASEPSPGHHVSCFLYPGKTTEPGIGNQELGKRERGTGNGTGPGV